MTCLTCDSRPFSRQSGFAAISRAAAKSAASRLRSLGILPTNVDWAKRATMCERCPLRVISGKTTYCGSPFLEKPLRDQAQDGCGCPTIAKAKDPTEHCPITPRHQPATRADGSCTCKWCQPAVAPRAVLT